MRPVVIAVVLIFVAAFYAPASMASEAAELRTESDQYYENSDFKKAYKGYYKLAKAGDRHSQSKVSHMYANGEGKSVDLTEAYAWSRVASESGKEKYVKVSDDLLPKTKDRAAAEKRADKLIGKYGKQAQRERTARLSAKENDKRSGQCTGTRLACSRG